MPDQSAASKGSPSAAVATPRTKSPSKSPSPPLQPDIIAVGDRGDDLDDDGDSALGSDAGSSTASLASSILRYRTIQGRTFNSENFSQYFTPNDSKQQDSVDISNHYLTLLLGGELTLAPIPNDVKKVVDIGTGTGIWAIDFADRYPSAEVIGTDISPIQPIWVPPNTKFEIDDATRTWSWEDNSIDFVHMRYLVGGITDWHALMAEAYRCCKPGGWVETCECDPLFLSDDGTADNNPYIAKWRELYYEAGKKLGRSFTVITDNLQRPAVEATGLVDIQERNFKIPVGDWPADPKLAEIGQFGQLTLENDVEGYTLFVWNSVLGWDMAEYQIFLMGIRKMIRDRKIHAYFTVRYIWGRKPPSS